MQEAVSVFTFGKIGETAFCLKNKDVKTLKRLQCFSGGAINIPCLDRIGKFARFFQS